MKNHQGPPKTIFVNVFFQDDDSTTTPYFIFLAGKDYSVAIEVTDPNHHSACSKKLTYPALSVNNVAKMLNDVVSGGFLTHIGNNSDKDSVKLLNLIEKIHNDENPRNYKLMSLESHLNDQNANEAIKNMANRLYEGHDALKILEAYAMATSEIPF